MNSIRLKILVYFYKVENKIMTNKYYLAFTLCITDCILGILSKLYETKNENMATYYGWSSAIVFALLYILIYSNEKDKFPKNLFTPLAFLTISAFIMLFSPCILKVEPIGQVVLMSIGLLVLIYSFTKAFADMIRKVGSFLEISRKPLLKNIIAILTTIASIVGPIATILKLIADKVAW